MTWVDFWGWTGSVLLIWSLTQARVLRFRVLNFIASVVLVAFNAYLGIWSMAVMNGIIGVINVWHIVALMRTHRTQRDYQISEMSIDEPFLTTLVQTHRADIKTFYPAFDDTVLPPSGGHDMKAFVLSHRTSIVGIVIGQIRTRENTRHFDVVVDYVLPEFRDFSPGRALYGPSGPLQQLGLSSVCAPNTALSSSYFDRMGFTRTSQARVLTLNQN